MVVWGTGALLKHEKMILICIVSLKNNSHACFAGSGLKDIFDIYIYIYIYIKSISNFINIIVKL